MTYLKNQCFALLRHYITVLVLDCDILVQDDLEDLFNTKCDVAWRTGFTFYQKLAPLERHLGLKISEIPDFSCFNAKTRSPNGGVILLHDDFDYEKAYADSMAFLRTYMIYFVSAVDELSIGYACYKNNLSVFPLNREMYNSTLRFYSVETKIVHFFGLDGKAKPWNNPLVHMMFQEWMSCYREFSGKTGIRSDAVENYGHLGRNILVPQLHKQHWLQFIARKDFDVPRQLQMEYVFSNEHLILRYNDSLYYEFCYDLWTRDKMQCGVVVITNGNDELQNIVKTVATQSMGFVVHEGGDSIRLLSNTCSQEQVIQRFHALFFHTEPLRNFFEGAGTDQKPETSLLTWRNAFLSANLDKLCLCQSKEPSDDLLITVTKNSVTLFIRSLHKYITDIHKDGSFTLSHEPHAFTVVYQEKQLSLLSDGLYLSARDDGSFSLAQRNRAWEWFHKWNCSDRESDKIKLVNSTFDRVT